ncbi:hypothetical protein ASE01_19360 [Nocardioides sp. Root190]|uniref:carboxypeptidase-like regulatory domain-containing protein n=1 Tax=Nocardioides sp. Root190 TaxID=1736488 RepID=UPI000700C9B8|nr:carboxypeptidase regulatory-like domain-containing protein [Nocardioides sp. Root190]KRB74141.1 hypothetical protein ASE01_19360 [Nocardioides sp. Root190]
MKVVANATVQGGVVGGDPSETPKWVQPSYTYGTRYVDGTSLGRIYALPAYVRGKLVDAVTSAPVVGASVRLRHASGNAIAVHVLTDRNGIFRLKPVKGEDFNLQVVGSGVGYENGYRGCEVSGKAPVVPTIGDACQSDLGDIGRVYVDQLPGPA